METQQEREMKTDEREEKLKTNWRKNKEPEEEEEGVKWCRDWINCYLTNNLRSHDFNRSNGSNTDSNSQKMFDFKLKRTYFNSLSKSASAGGGEEEEEDDAEEEKEDKEGEEEEQMLICRNDEILLFLINPFFNFLIFLLSRGWTL